MILFLIHWRVCPREAPLLPLPGLESPPKIASCQGSLGPISLFSSLDKVTGLRDQPSSSPESQGTLISALEKAWEPHTHSVTPAGEILESKGKTPECVVWKISLGGGFSRFHIHLVSSILGGWPWGRQSWSLCSPLSKWSGGC